MCTQQIFVIRALLLIYTNELTKYISSTNKLFTNDNSILSIVKDTNVSEYDLSSDQQKNVYWFTRRCQSI